MNALCNKSHRVTTSSLRNQIRCIFQTSFASVMLKWFLHTICPEKLCVRTANVCLFHDQSLHAELLLFNESECGWWLSADARSYSTHLINLPQAHCQTHQVHTSAVCVCVCELLRNLPIDLHKLRFDPWCHCSNWDFMVSFVLILCSPCSSTCRIAMHPDLCKEVRFLSTTQNSFNYDIVNETIGIFLLVSNNFRIPFFLFPTLRIGRTHFDRGKSRNFRIWNTQHGEMDARTQQMPARLANIFFFAVILLKSQHMFHFCTEKNAGNLWTQIYAFGMWSKMATHAEHIF